MLPDERFLSLCRMQGPGTRLVPLGRGVLVTARPNLARGSQQGPGRRMPSQAQSCFPAKENTLGVGFRLRRAPANQQGPGSQRQPSPALPNGMRCPGWENGLRCFPEQRRSGAGVCSPRSFSCPFADCRAQELGWCLWGVGAFVQSGPASLGLYCWGMGEEGLRTFNPASP